MCLDANSDLLWFDLVAEASTLFYSPDPIYRTRGLQRFCARKFILREIQNLGVQKAENLDLTRNPF